MTDKLYEFICAKCSRTLVWTFSVSKVYCPYCSRWMNFEDLKNPRTEIVAGPEYREDEIKEQLSIF